MKTQPNVNMMPWSQALFPWLSPLVVDLIIVKQMIKGARTCIVDGGWLTNEPCSKTNIVNHELRQTSLVKGPRLGFLKLSHK